MAKRHALLTGLAIGLILFAAGCSKRAADPASLKLLQAAGDRAAMTIVVRPNRYAAAMQTLRPLLQAIEEPGLQGVLATKDLWSGARAVVAAIPAQGKPDLPQDLPGWDRTRPIVAALFEPQVSDLVLAARSVLPMSMRQILETGLPGLRHRVLVPATDPRALAQALAKLFDQVGAKAYVAGQSDPNLRGGFLFLSRAHDGFVALIPEQDHLRIELLTEDHTPAEDDAERVAIWSGLLDRPVGQPAAGTASPAVRLAVSGDHFAAVLVRPWQLRDLGSQIGTRQLVDAMTQVAIDMRLQLMAAGLAAVANGYLMMDRERPEFEDLCVAFDLEGGLRTTAVISLTEHGAKIFKAGLEQGRPPPAPRGEPLAWAWSRLDLNAMLQTAGTLPSLSRAKKPNEILQALQECGPFCSLHLLATSPFGAARTAVDFAPVDLSNKLPQGFSLALMGLDPVGPKVRAEVAARFPAGFNTRPIRQALREMSPRTPFAGELALHSENVSGDELISLTLGLRPGDGLAGRVEAPDGLLGEARVDLAKLVGLLVPGGSDRQPAWVQSLSQLGTWRSRSRLVERALVGESLLTIGETEKKLAWIDPAAFGGKTWDAGAPGAPTKGERCLQRVTRSMMEGFRALAMVAPEQRNMLLAKAVQETDAPLACALAESDTAERARRTQSMVHLFLADRMAEDFNDEGERAVLSKACKLGHQAACQRAEAIGGRPQIALAEVKGVCGPGVGWGQPVLRIETAADVQAQVVGYEAAPGTPAPNLAVDAGAPWSVVGSALEALAEKGFDRTGLVIHEPSGGVQVIEVARPGAKAKVDPYGGPRFVRLEEPGERRGEIALMVESTQVLLIDQDGAAFLKNRQDCKQGEVCTDLEVLGPEYDRRSRRLSPEAKVRIQIAPDVPFREAAAVLGLISCTEPRQRWGHARAREIVVGPLPDGMAIKANAREITAEEAKRGGILAILGSKAEDGAMGSMSAGGGFGGLGTYGSGGLGSLKGVGQGGGGSGVGGLGGLRASKGSQPRIRTGLPVIMGSLSKEIIRRTIRRQLSQIRYCYEKQLIREPGLQGRVAIKFVIAPTGAVQSAQVAKTTLKSKSVEACLVKVLKRMQFPKPKGGGIVIVNYPFTFTSDGATRSGKKAAETDSGEAPGSAVSMLTKVGTGGGIGADVGNAKRSKTPSPRIKTGRPVVLGAMSKEIISRVMRRRFVRFRTCYERQLQRNPELSGKLVVKFVISSTGTVQSAATVDATLKSKPLEECVLETIEQTRFPAARDSGIVTVTYPLTFGAGQASQDAE